MLMQLKKLVVDENVTEEAAVEETPELQLKKTPAEEVTEENATVEEPKED